MGKIWTTKMLGLWVKQDAASGNCSFIAKTAFEAAATADYGAAAGWMTVDVSGGGGGAAAADTLAVEVGMFNKSTTRIPVRHPEPPNQHTPARGDLCEPAC